MVAAAAAAPAIPTWPATFNVSFYEMDSDLVGQDHYFNGSWMYDFTNKRQRIDRTTGKYDRYCGSVKGDDSPCQHLVVAGIRYLIWPVLNYCCSCCNAAAGCGIVDPKWMQLSNGTFVNTSRVTTPVYTGTVDTFLIMGLQPNYWLQENTTGRFVGFYQEPEDLQYFHPESYKAGGEQPDSLFTIPSYCSGACPLLSICTFAG